jgi:hypothetical protein
VRSHGRRSSWPFASSIVIALLTSACASGTASPPPTFTSAPTVAVPPTGVPTTQLVSPGPIPTFDGDVGLHAGTYVFHFTRLDELGKPFPRVLVTVPDGWSAFRGFGVDAGSGLRYSFVSFWGVVDVYKNPCHWQGPKLQSGTTVEELAAVLAAQPLRNATVPASVSLGGYDGKFLEQSVPNDIVFADCDKDPSDGQNYFESWTGSGLWNAPWDPAGTTDRYEQGPGQVDRLWILGVEGRRLVIDASYMPGATTQDKADVQRVVDSIRFVP